LEHTKDRRALREPRPFVITPRTPSARGLDPILFAHHRGAECLENHRRFLGAELFRQVAFKACTKPVQMRAGPLIIGVRVEQRKFSDLGEENVDKRVPVERRRAATKTISP